MADGLYARSNDDGGNAGWCMSYEIKNASDAVKWLIQPGIQASAFGDETTKEAVNYLIRYVVRLYYAKRKVDK